MHPSPGIQFLTNNQVNKQQWDEVVKAAANSLIYSHSFYLDAMCQQWAALAAPDYSWVLPLTHRKKWGISYLYQPAFTQQSGVFAKAGVFVPYKDIAAWLRRHYRFAEVAWNYATCAEQLSSSFKIATAINMVLHLAPGYKNIAAGYKKDVTGNLKRSRQFNLIYQKTTDYKQCIELFRQAYSKRLPHITNADFFNFTNVASYADKHGMLVCRLATDKNAAIMAAVLLLNDGHRLYNLMNTTTAAGRQTEANYFLLDAVIREFAGHDLVLDFEGSDVPGIKRFYENFGATNQPYFTLKYNALPWPVRLFKQ